MSERRSLLFRVCGVFLGVTALCFLTLPASWHMVRSIDFIAMIIIAAMFSFIGWPRRA